MVCENSGRDLRKGEVRQSPSKLSARIAELEAPGQNDGQCRPGHHTELAQAGHGARQRPARHRNAHPALNDLGF